MCRIVIGSPEINERRGPAVYIIHHMHVPVSLGKIEWRLSQSAERIENDYVRIVDLAAELIRRVLGHVAGMRHKSIEDIVLYILVDCLLYFHRRAAAEEACVVIEANVFCVPVRAEVASVDAEECVILIPQSIYRAFGQLPVEGSLRPHVTLYISELAIRDVEVVVHTLMIGEVRVTSIEVIDDAMVQTNRGIISGGANESACYCNTIGTFPEQVYAI